MNRAPLLGCLSLLAGAVSAAEYSVVSTRFQLAETDARLAAIR